MRGRHRRRGFIGKGWLTVCAIAVIAPTNSLRADTADLDDAAARIQYAFYTSDSRGLEDVLSLMKGMDAATVPGMTQYYSAYGNWKLSELYSATEAAGGKIPRGAISRAAQECERQAKAATAADARLAEAYAIEAICAAENATLIGGDCSRSKSLRTAVELEPKNPRIHLIEFLCSAKDDRNSAAVLQKVRGVVASFETAAPSRPGKPDWGYAEALVLLGQTSLKAGDSMAARDALERALALAPDYKTAQDLAKSARTK